METLPAPHVTDPASFSVVPPRIHISDHRNAAFPRPFTKRCCAPAAMTLTARRPIHLLCHQQRREALKLFTVIGTILSFSPLNA